MPKRTKKAKILAYLHRQEQLSKEINSQSVKKQNQPQTYVLPQPRSNLFQSNDLAVAKLKTVNIIQDYSYVKHDLMKITIFSILALVFQGVLYFLLNRG